MDFYVEDNIANLKDVAGATVSIILQGIYNSLKIK